MMRHMMHSYHGMDGHRRDERPGQGSTENWLDAVSWAALLIWLGSSWLAALPFGYILVGAGIVMLLAELARYMFAVGVEGFWVLIGCGLFAAGYWDLWNVGIPLAPIVLIAAGIGVLAWQFRDRLR